MFLFWCTVDRSTKIGSRCARSAIANYNSFEELKDAYGNQTWAIFIYFNFLLIREFFCIFFSSILFCLTFSFCLLLLCYSPFSFLLFLCNHTLSSLLIIFFLPLFNSPTSPLSSRTLLLLSFRHARNWMLSGRFFCINNGGVLILISKIYSSRHSPTPSPTHL